MRVRIDARHPPLHADRPARGSSRCRGRHAFPAPRCSGPCRCPASRKRDAAAAKTRLHERFRWFGGGWKVNAELPGPASFAGATTDVRPEDVAESIPCGADVDAVIQACTPFAEAGFTDLALVQIGGQQQGTFLDWAEQNLRPELRRRLG